MREMMTGGEESNAGSISQLPIYLLPMQDITRIAMLSSFVTSQSASQLPDIAFEALVKQMLSKPERICNSIDLKE